MSWWPAEGDASDNADTNPGTLQGGASFGAGESGQAFTFNGSTGYASVADSANLSPAGSLTVDAWVYLQSYNSFFAPILSKWNDLGVNERGYSLTVLATGYARWDVSTNGTYSTTGQSTPGGAASADNAFVVSSAQVPLDTWTHLAGSFDSATGGGGDLRERNRGHLGHGAIQHGI